MDIIKKKINIKMEETLNVVVTGAAGQIAYALYGFLGTFNYFT